ncbi:MAG: 5-amino-6-(D-ribitylamino)uracil--L-tyrosine 4-hydroxyphenyl transferase CofH [Pseudomonadota bacterium]|nr:5-amino-6-(D-ribitylamino)uracil--L-tyrosine 4-hydroxyphenyl transferase CofH [Pseudomonadota bacterium]
MSAKTISTNYLLNASLSELLERAAVLRNSGHADRLSYSRKVFIPLTRLCRDSCSYCTFATTPSNLPNPYLLPDEVLKIAHDGKTTGCKEALFTLGDKPELRYNVASKFLSEMGYTSTIEYLAAMCRLVYEETGLLPHANPGALTLKELEILRPVTVSMGMMLESTAPNLHESGGAHHGSPDKLPKARLQTLHDAGTAMVPFTTGILIGIGETRERRIKDLLMINELHKTYGHIQEIIVQNFRAKPATRMANAPEPNLDDHLWTIACARLIFGAEMNIQAPPNLSPDVYQKLVEAGLNDWGGISPVTPDHVNPEAVWPEIDTLAKRSAETGKTLVERLAVYPSFIRDASRWMASEMETAAIRASDADGMARTESWAPGIDIKPPAISTRRSSLSPDINTILRRFSGGGVPNETDITRLFEARDIDFTEICKTADALRRGSNGDDVTYVVNRNINYTNICTYRCTFCAFSKGKTANKLRDKPYRLETSEIARRAAEAWSRGATEVCLQGGIHPEFTGDTYLDICAAVKDTAPDIHIHAFSPLEITQGARTLDLSIEDFLSRLKDVGLSTLPGTAAEILDDEIRATLCPDKINTDKWLSVMETAHGLGLRTTATIMYGHMEQPAHWARHLMRIRTLQERTGGFTEFVPLPFVHMAAPIYLKGVARRGPTFRETVLMHAIARIVLHPVIHNIQASWVKVGQQGIKACLNAGVNDLGGTLMNESISRAAGTVHGQECNPQEIERIIKNAGRQPVQRTTLYKKVTLERERASYNAGPLAAIA